MIARAGRIVSPMLVAREGELVRLAEAVATAPSVVVVEGEAGIGKTRLVAELALRPETAGRRWLRGGCGQVREPFPLGPVVEALRGQAPALDGAALSPVTGALGALLPELQAVLPEAPAPLEDRAAERHRVLRGLVEVLSALGPAVLVLEDLHWADQQTVEFLAYLVRAMPNALSVVLTYRGEEADPALRAATARLADTITGEHITLRPMDVAGTRALAAAILQTEEVSPEFAEHLCARSSGLPLAIQELLAMLRMQGKLIRWKGGWARRALDELDVPEGVRAPVRERVARMSPAARSVMEAASVLRLAVPAATLAGVAGVSGALAGVEGVSGALAGVEGVSGALAGVADVSGAEALDEALDSGLLIEQGSLVAFRHVLAAEAVYEGVPMGRRQALHAAAAAATRGLRPVPLGQVAHHLRHAGRPEEWVAAAVAAAEHATGLGNDAEAARLLEEVLRHAGLDPVRRAELTIRLGWAATYTLRIPAIGELLEEALGHELPRRLRGELRMLLALYLDTIRVDDLRVRQAFADAVPDLDELPELAAWAMVGLGVPTTTDVPFAERLPWLERALETVPADGEPGPRVFVLGKIAMIFASSGEPRWWALTERILAETGGRPSSRQEVGAYRSIGGAAVDAGHHQVATRLLEAALDAGRGASGSARDDLTLRASLAMARYYGGAWTGLREELAALREQCDNRPYERLHIDLIAACLAPAPSRLDAARDMLAGLIRDLRVRGDLDMAAAPVTTLLRLACARGEAGAALAETADVVAGWEARDLWPIGVRAVAAVTEALLSAGRPGEAADLVGRYEIRTRGLDAPLAVPALALAHGHLDAHAGRWARAARRYGEAAAAYAKLPAVYDAAQAVEQQAACLFERGDPEAGATLTRAIETYTQLEARWDLDRATQLARRQGLRPTSRIRASQDGEATGLTARQAQVARLAADGLTNQEIARQMFLSPKTVDKHLGAAMRKLGARSRVELGRHLGGTPGA
ncbi:helix-turn-helix transcriptional regulator [Nonomuraea soli]|uniref:DNA-binding CsgD family transcriptional regulator n=1 Tax=Nonomuraea soli TaxID=1032476 RepID=A0A7W0HNZ2_9ACTN|nr:LuxR family transcriptional regulator [Nonomuraea soli]MBA2890212.1 DNA-binding CsgD family transcriptional regulator [Nonomuraea soli]